VKPMKCVPSLVIATMLVAARAASAQVTSVDVGFVTSPGPVAACPVPITLKATIHFTVDELHTGNHQIQYKWIDSAGNSYETQTLTLPLAGNALFTVVQQSFNWHGAGAAWVALQTAYPTSVTSNKANFQLTCPSPGSLTMAP